MNSSARTESLAIALVVSSALLVFGLYSPLVSAHEIGEKDSVTIHVTEKGFKPVEVTIQPGTKVIFENAGEEKQWPASDNHPSHTLYDGTSIDEHCDGDASPTFDSCGPLSAGDTWSFVFEREGVFSYHDHLWPHLDGKIIVSNTEGENDKNVFPRFLDHLHQIGIKIASFFIRHEETLDLNSGNAQGEFYDNLKTHYKNLVSEADPRKAIHALQEESLYDPAVSALCHDILHEIGHAAYQKYGSFSEATKFQSDFCNSGYIHGIFESYFESTTDPLSGLAEQCAAYASFGGRPFDLWQCHHGVGHGFMYLTGGDLDKSLSLCEEGLGTDGKASCQNGVFMEVFNLEVIAKENDYIDPANPFLTCSTRTTAKEDCYLYMPTYLSQTKNMSFSDIFKACDGAEIGYRSSCIHGVGSEMMKRNMDEPDVVFAACEQAGSFISQEICVRGIVGMYMNQAGSYSAGKALCADAPQRFRNTCDNAVHSSESFFRQER